MTLTEREEYIKIVIKNKNFDEAYNKITDSELSIDKKQKYFKELIKESKTNLTHSCKAIKYLINNKFTEEGRELIYLLKKGSKFYDNHKNRPLFNVMIKSFEKKISDLEESSLEIEHGNDIFR